ncbi:MAG TPA: NAD(P)H-binding protein [Candidatus Sulfotelmatobacter sp.]
MATQSHCIFVAGGTGYMGQRMIARLLERGHQVRALVRPGSEQKLPSGSTAIPGNTLDSATYINQIAPADTFVQLVGVAHPSPAKAEQFKKIDLVSGLGAIAAARSAAIKHFVYLSVGQPAPMMKAYIAVRAECEAAIQTAQLNATILRPWYVLGPGHRWPYLLIPMYKLAELIPQTREGAVRLGLLTLDQMTLALVAAVENPVHGIRIVTAPEIRVAALA